MTSSPDETSDAEVPRQTITLNEAVLASVVESYYPDAVRAGTSARLRAQAAQSVATALAGAAVASLTLSNFKQLDPKLRLVGCVTILAWTVASILYMRAVGAPAPDIDKLRGVNDPDSLIKIVLERSREERKSVDGRQKWGNIAAAAGAVLTAFTFAAAVLLPDYHEEKKATLILSSDQAVLVEKNDCGTTVNISGKLRTESLKTDMLEFVIKCGEKESLLLLPKRDVKGIVVDDS
ncbi:hypothetical protein [Actinoplanes xinjiangensis]|uniref:Uncharacterized protein n=1 Tax=Actinoplanes xinjiangensis TaxID=512350 RepID=A0A316FF61_9ACTN|nr:hypothetical protein [Actinoplanes xinjiangensis]PWK46306.1 hypothetical protein BC793_110300 [Actinoplanes xinjiangensis]GIF40757.1 hypothetical protein Axi01nite_50680 [Actinoplanes xinjiangensis]